MNKNAAINFVLQNARPLELAIYKYFFENELNQAVIDELYRNKGIGKTAIEQIIKTDLQHMHTNKILLRVREENERAIRCYKSVGFKENRRYQKDNLNVIEMIYEN